MVRGILNTEILRGAGTHRHLSYYMGATEARYSLPGPPTWPSPPIQWQFQVQQHCSHLGQPQFLPELVAPLAPLKQERDAAQQQQPLRAGDVPLLLQVGMGLVPACPMQQQAGTEEPGHFYLCDCILPFDALDVYSFITY